MKTTLIAFFVLIQFYCYSQSQITDVITITNGGIPGVAGDPGNCLGLSYESMLSKATTRVLSTHQGYKIVIMTASERVQWNSNNAIIFFLLEKIDDTREKLLAQQLEDLKKKIDEATLKNKDLIKSELSILFTDWLSKMNSELIYKTQSEALLKQFMAKVDETLSKYKLELKNNEQTSKPK